MTALWPVDQLMEQGLVEQTISGWTDEVDFPDFPEGYFEIPPSSGLPAGHETDNFPIREYFIDNNSCIFAAGN